MENSTPKWLRLIVEIVELDCTNRKRVPPSATAVPWGGTVTNLDRPNVLHVPLELPLQVRVQACALIVPAASFNRPRLPQLVDFAMLVSTVLRQSTPFVWTALLANLPESLRAVLATCVGRDEVVAWVAVVVRTVLLVCSLTALGPAHVPCVSEVEHPDSLSRRLLEVPRYAVYVRLVTFMIAKVDRNATNVTQAGSQPHVELLRATVNAMQVTLPILEPVVARHAPPAPLGPETAHHHNQRVQRVRSVNSVMSAVARNVIYVRLEPTRTRSVIPFASSVLCKPNLNLAPRNVFSLIQQASSLSSS